MKKFTLGSVVAIFISTSFSVPAQVPPVDPPKVRDRVVVTDMLPPARHIPSKAPIARPTPIVVQSTSPNRVSEGPADEINDRPENTAAKVTLPRGFGFAAIKGKIAEAKRMLKTRPLPTASAESTTPLDFVRIAFHDWETGEIDFVFMSKEAFLSTAGPKQVVSQEGKALTARTIRGNGVNTPITLIDENGTNHLPLLVQYPVIRNGKYIETAYYMSTHPGLVTPEVVNAGRLYVRNVIDAAREQLRQRGITIQPKIADIAERLAAVEHVDHLRFRTEFHPNIYNDIYTLFALNEGQTYRYAVSSAGAGGMVQMIPSTYRMVRSWHPNVPLNPDFVEGMQDHLNASKAMLLYMQRTWNDLNSSPTVNAAIAAGFATQEHLMAAGYNSNPARLPAYISRGGTNWATLIPRETRIYLQIYDSIERHVPMSPRIR